MAKREIPGRLTRLIRRITRKGVKAEQRGPDGDTQGIGTAQGGDSSAGQVANGQSKPDAQAVDRLLRSLENEISAAYHNADALAALAKDVRELGTPLADCRDVLGNITTRIQAIGEQYRASISQDVGK